MPEFKYKLNLRTGKYDLVPSAAVVSYKAGVANAAALPTEGNILNDGRITADDGHLHVWDGSAWQDQGDIIDLYWSSIVGRPTASIDDIDDAVSKRHTQNTDQYLDYGGTFQLPVQAVAWRNYWGNTNYYINPDTGSDTTGDGSSGNPFKTIQHAIDIIPPLNNGFSHRIRLQSSLNYDEEIKMTMKLGGMVEIRSESGNPADVLIKNSSDSHVFDISGCSSRIYIRNVSIRVMNDNRRCINVQKNSAVYVENVPLGDNGNTGTRGISATENSIVVAKSVTNLDGNKVETGLYANTGIILSDNCSVGDTKTLVNGNGTITEGSILIQETTFNEAISKRHDQNTDQYLDFGGANQVAVADAKDAVTKKHTQNTDGYLDFGGANQIAANEISRKLLVNTDYYISPSGSDISGDGSTGNPFLTVQHAIDLLPKNINGKTVQILLKDGTYASQTVDIEDFYGGGYLWIYSESFDATKVTFPTVVTMNRCKMEVYWGAMTLNLSDPYAFNIYECSNVWIQNNAIGYYTDAIWVGMSNLYLDGNTNIAGYAVTNAIYAYQGSIVDVSGQTAFGTNFIKSTSTGSIITDGSIVAVGGKVGIGTLTPASKLHIKDLTSYAELFKLEGSGGDFRVFGAGGEQIFRFSNELTIRQGDTERFKMNYDGNLWLNHVSGKVGIGTNSPTYKLDIQGTEANSVKIVNNNSGTGDKDKILLHLQQNTGGSYGSGAQADVYHYLSGINNRNYIIEWEENSAALSYLKFSKFGDVILANLQGESGAGLALKTNDQTRLYIKQDGKVSIGITDPVADFVATGANGTALLGGYQYPSAWSSGLLVRLFDETGHGWGYDLIPGLSSGGAAFRVKVGVVSKTGQLGSVSSTLFDIDGATQNIGIGGFSESGTVLKVSNIHDDDRTLLVLRPTASQTKNQMEWQNSSGTPIGGVNVAGELKIKVYKQTSEPTLTADDFLAIWQDTDDSYRTYLVYRRGFTVSGAAEQVAVELTG